MINKYTFINIKYAAKEFFRKVFRKNHLSNSEIYNLGFSMAPYILKRLKAFREYDRMGFPIVFGEWDECYGKTIEEFESDPVYVGGEEEAWNKILDEMIFAFEMLLSEEHRNTKKEKAFFDKYNCNWKEEKPENLHEYGWTRRADGKTYVMEKGGKEHKTSFYFDYPLYQECLKRQQRGFKFFGEFYANLWD